MKDCIYTITIDGKVLKIKGESELDRIILDNYKSLIKFVPNANTLFSFDKTNSDILQSAQAEAKSRLNQVRTKALAEYLNTDSDVSYTDGSVSVSEWLIRTKLSNGVNRDNYTKEMKSKLKAKDPTLSSQQIEDKINKEFASWTYSQRLGRGLHYITDTIFNTKLKLTPQSARTKLNNSWTKGFSRDSLLDGLSDEALTSFINQINSLKSQLKGSDVEQVYTEYVAEYQMDEDTTLVGKMDIVVVKKDGTVHIYDLKVSGTRRDDWDLDRINFAHTQVAVYKRILQQHGINGRKIFTHIIPVEININKELLDERDGELVVSNSADVITALTVHEPEPIELNMKQVLKLNDVFPIDSSISVSTSKLEETITNNLSKYFPVEHLNNNKFTNITKQNLLDQAKKGPDGKLRFWNSILGRFEHFNSREELSNFLNTYLADSEQALSDKVNIVTRGFVEVLNTVNSSSDYTPINLNFPNVRKPEHQAYLNTLFKKYTYERGWKVVNNGDLINLGVIMLINDSLRKVDFITLTDMDPNVKVKLPKGSSLFGSFFTDSEVEANENKLPASKGNIELIKLLEIADSIMTDNLKEYTIDDLVVANIDTKNAVKPTSLDKILYNYNVLRNKTGRNSSELINLDPLHRFYQTFDQIQTGISRLRSESRLSNTIKGRIKMITSPITDLTPDERNIQLKQLYALLDDIKNKFFYDGYKPNDSLESALYSETARAILNISGVQVDAYNTPKLAEWFGDVWKDGGVNRQLLNSTKLNTSDTIKLVEPIKKILNSTRYNIKSNYYHYKTPSRKEYKKFKDGSISSNKLINLAENEYKQLFDTSENGQKYFLLKDPKTDTTLNQRQKDFLEYYLKDINSLRFPGQSEESLRASGQWLMAGIMKASTASRIANSSNIIGVFHAINANITDDIINRKQVVEEDNLKSFTQLGDEVMSEMYNIFSTSNTLEARAQLIDRLRKERGDVRDPMGIFETNLELVADTMHLSYIRENEYNKILPIIQANLTILRLTSFISSDKDIEKTIQFIVDHINTTVFDESLIDSESKQVYVAASHLKRVASAAILGFNFKSGIKETLVSFIALYTRAIASSLTDKDKLGIKDITSAYFTVWKDALSQVSVVTKLESLNAIYGISNMSEDELVSRMNYYQGDPMRFQGNMFWFNRAPDYLNRLTILVGYMKKYGCYDAYTMKDDKLVYDWKKDKRFAIYAQYKNSEHMVPSSQLYDFQYQRSLYNTMMDSFIKQDLQIEDKETGKLRSVTKEDQLPHAFTTDETAAIKQEADMLFGYMDNDNKSEYLKRGLFTIIGHFQTYLSAKKSQWFLTRDVYAGGHMAHAKNEAGELLYMNYDDNGKLLSITTKKTDHPYVKWEGSITEGMFWSILDLVYTPARAIFDKDYRGKVGEVWKDKVKRRNALIASQELFLLWLIMYLLKTALGDTKLGELTPEQRTFIGLTREVRNELNILNVLQGGVEFNAPSFDFAKNITGDLYKVFDGKLNLGRVFINNFGAFRPLKHSLYEYFPNPEYKRTAASDLL